MTRLVLIAAVMLSLATISSAGDNQGKSATPTRTFTPSVGYLKVYTHAVERYDDGMWRSEFTSYNVLSGDGGTLIRSVGTSLDEPQTIRLSEGTYIIRAALQKGKPEDFRVVIEGGKTTEVLD
jgi:hypothetical protein